MSSSQIVIDIETIPDQSDGALDRIKEGLTVKAPDLTKPKLIEALKLGDDSKYKTVPELKGMWVEEFGKEALDVQAREKWLKTSFDGAYGEICCVGIKAGYDYRSFVGSEKEILNNLWDYISVVAASGLAGKALRLGAPYFIVHNAKFDLPFLYHRSVINKVSPPPFSPHGRHGSDYFCTMTAWAGFNGKIGLDRLAGILGIKGKGGMSGADVWPEYEKGNISKIAAYCRDDVRITSEIHKRLTFG